MYVARDFAKQGYQTFIHVYVMREKVLVYGESVLILGVFARGIRDHLDYGEARYCSQINPY